MTQNLTSSNLKPEDAIFREVVNAGMPFHKKVKKGQVVRILDLKGNQAADTLFYNAHDPRERYSATDTIRSQANIYLTTGTKLISSEGNVLLEIVADTCGRHDTLGGACAAESNMIRYALDKKHMHNCRDSFLMAMASWDAPLPVDKRDITSNINFFMNVPVTTNGGLSFEDGISDALKYVELKAWMDVVLVMSNCPQLNNPCNAYNPTPVEILIWKSQD
ncbi:MAG: urea carboxylase [Spirochaetaceae bacterium]|nr:urea carboxylase [Spirochaetaceae bacterium]|tara:strand:- start:7553 stop:8212 length:660 start_codon:yes stop_codon:yes gene_type:complete